MKKIFISLIMIFFSFSSLSIAGDVYVDGYYRSDGTYVKPHVRSSPDDAISNNYGPSQSDFERMNPRSRDYDNDGLPNYQDYDSDNDGLFDNQDPNPYGKSNNDNYGW